MCSCVVFVVFFFKQKTAYEMRISDWSSDVCSSDLISSVSATFWSIRRRETPSWASWRSSATPGAGGMPVTAASWRACIAAIRDRKSTRLNSSTNAHLVCRLLLEKKKKQTKHKQQRYIRHYKENRKHKKCTDRHKIIENKTQ